MLTFAASIPALGLLSFSFWSWMPRNFCWESWSRQLCSAACSAAEQVQHAICEASLQWNLDSPPGLSSAAHAAAFSAAERASAGRFGRSDGLSQRNSGRRRRSLDAHCYHRSCRRRALFRILSKFSMVVGVAVLLASWWCRVADDGLEPLSHCEVRHPFICMMVARICSTACALEPLARMCRIHREPNSKVLAARALLAASCG